MRHDSVTIMGRLIVVDCEAPFGVGAPSVGDMTEFGAVDVNALRDGSTETFHGTDCSEETFRQFREWLGPRMPVVFVSDNPAYDFQWINFYFWKYQGENPFGHSGRRIADFYAGLVGDFRNTQRWKRLRRTRHDTIRCTTHSATPRRCFGCSTGNGEGGEWAGGTGQVIVARSPPPQKHLPRPWQGETACDSTGAPLPRSPARDHRAGGPASTHPDR